MKEGSGAGIRQVCGNRWNTHPNFCDFCYILDMNADALFRRYQELQRYVNWKADDAALVTELSATVEPLFPALVDDFYAEIQKHPDALKVITGGQEQINRLKGTLILWLRELFSGCYDSAYVNRRWRVGWRHVQIGLNQVYTNVAMSRLRTGMLQALHEHWSGSAPDLLAGISALEKLLDLDLAIIEDAYQTEYTERQQRQERLATIGQLAGTAPCMIVILRPNHAIVYFSPFAEELTGYRASDVLGKDYLLTFLATEHREPMADALRHMMAQASTRGYENPVVCRDGSQRSMVWNFQCLADYEGAPALLAVGQDITNVKEAQERALQAERLAAIGQMVAGLTHESGNALARCQACLEMLALEVEDRPEALDLISRAQKAQDHLRQLYEDVRGYAAPIKLQREVWDVGGIWRQAWQNLAMLRKGRDAAIREHTHGLDLHCSVDHFRLEQVFRNIMENTLAACKDPAVLEVSCAATQLDRRPALHIQVCDNGPGFSPEQRQHIFEPFFTTKTKGTGLGMAIAKRIIEAHRGLITVGEPAASAKGVGAQIYITLPRE
ncbi:MAG TPA: protoglobin domain-containing protein [Gemmataceae bacterium]|nr:protoglobin domain-containing protein [Gemmataceae bacterium]